MTSLNIVVITFRKLLPCVTLGALLVQTTPIRLLMHAMQKWHLPQAVIIPLAITVRYFPTLHEEQQAISDAMKLRNVHGVFQKLEYIYVPLMLSASTTADELSQAKTVGLTRHEYDLLLYLALSPNRVFTKEQIYQHIYEEAESEVNNRIYGLIKNLRKKIEENPETPHYIETIRGVGYRFRA